MRVLRYRDRVIHEKRMKDGTTQWSAHVKCLSGCCDLDIVHGTLASTKAHLDRQLGVHRTTSRVGTQILVSYEPW